MARRRSASSIHSPTARDIASREVQCEEQYTCSDTRAARCHNWKRALRIDAWAQTRASSYSVMGSGCECMIRRTSPRKRLLDGIR